MKNILVLFGGCSPEYPVSLQSAAAVLARIDRSRFRPLPLGISREGDWFLCAGDPAQVAADRWREQDCFPALFCPDRSGPALLVRGPAGFRRIPLDGAFPVLHGQNGEDGTVQGLLELAGLPLAGCGTLASALCMDKARAHALVSLSGVRVPRGRCFPAGESPERVLEQAEALGWPLFVKPLRAGSSFGVSRVERREELLPALEKASLYDRELIIEEAVPGRELGCAVLGSRQLFAGEPDEIQLSGGFFDYQEKYSPAASRIHCPARLSPEKRAEVKAAALKIYRVLGCAGFARVDLFLTLEGELVFNEVNTIPGLTAHSRFPAMLAAAGLSLEQAVNRILEEALAP